MLGFLSLHVVAVILGWVITVQGQDLRTLFGSEDTGFNVSIVLPGEPNYVNATKPFNLRFDFEPAAVAFPTSIQEISQLVKLGEKINHQVVARSGGHSYIANGLGGKDGVLVIDMRNFQKITVDDKAGTAVIETGNRLGDIVTALVAHGRAMPHGTCPYVGIGGHAAYGGFGFTSRLWGLTVDAIISIDLVLANGTITTASKNQSPDLFFAMRGSGASFGIATSITVQTFAAPPTATIFSYNWQFTAAGAAAALSSYQDFVLTANLPPEFGAEIVLTRGNVQGHVTVGLAGGWYAPLDQLNATLKPFFDRMPPPRAESFDTGDYLHSAVNLAGGSLDTTSQPDNTDTFYAKSLMTPESQPMSDRALEALMEVIANEGFTTSVGWFFQVELFGGRNSAINAVKAEDTAFARRDSLFTIQFYASSPGSVPPYPEAGFTFLDDTVNAIVTNSPLNWDYGAYTNYVDDRLVDWQKRYYAQNYPRLRRLKDLYDPRGTFSFPTSIQN
ncbi:glucooligosaccharide oxidase [Flammula alnicola]|nr:glucooligosaccharide oxidase [Flammula alnicola]